MKRENENPPVSEGLDNLHGTVETGEGYDLEHPRSERTGVPSDSFTDIRHGKEAPSAKRRWPNLKNTYYVAGLVFFVLKFLGVDEIAAEHFMSLVDSFLLQ